MRFRQNIPDEFFRKACDDPFIAKKGSHHEVDDIGSVWLSALAAMVGSSFAAPKEKAGEITLVSAPLLGNDFQCNLTNISGGTLVDVDIDILDTSGDSVAGAIATISDGRVGSVTHEPSRNMRYCEISYFGLPGVVRATFCFSDDISPVSGCVPVE